jgi:hypothetical protein
MKKITQILLTSATIFLFTITTPFAFGQEDTTKGKPTTGGQMKEAGKEVGKAGKSLGSNVKKGRVVRGGKRFGKHMGHAGKNVGSGTKKAAVETADKTEDVKDTTVDTSKDVAKKTTSVTKKVARKTVSVTKKGAKAVKKAVTP